MEDSLYRLERGDPSKLDGRALIYATVIVPPANLVYPSLYVGSNAFDLLDSDERETFGRAVQSIDQKDWGMNRDKPIKDMGQDLEALGITSRALAITNPHELRRWKGDIINTGRFDKYLVETALTHMGIVYMAKYASQWKERMSTMQGASGERTIEDLSLLEPEQLQRRLYSLTGELLEGVSGQDGAKVTRIKDVLVDFGNRANCRRELEGLIELAIGEHPSKLILTQKQAEMITAVRAENYEQAARLRDEIKALLV